MSSWKNLGAERIREFLPHRDPFLMVDEVVEIVPTSQILDLSVGRDKIGTRAVARKRIRVEEPHFAGHFPGFPIMPGVLQLEAMAQTASFCMYPYVVHQLKEWTQEFVCVFAGLDGARFRRPVFPGETLEMRAEVKVARSKLWAFDCQVTSAGSLTAEATVMMQIARYTELNFNG